MRTLVLEDVEMCDLGQRSAYTHVHTDISTLAGLLRRLRSEHITYRAAAACIHALIAAALFRV